jgi:vancomycin resistance protein YoaR
MRRPRPRLIIGLGAPIFVLVLLLAAWAIDSSSASGRVPRNVELVDRAVGKLPEDELANTVADLADYYAGVEIQVRTTEATYRVPAAELGLKLDQRATVQDALDVDEDVVLPGRPFVWASSFLADRPAPLTFAVDTATLESGLDTLAGNAAASEPELVVGADAITMISGSSGLRVESDGLAEQLVARAESGEEPIVVNANVTDRAPEVDDDEAQALADTLNLAIDEGFTVDPGRDAATIPPEVVRSWVGSEVEDGEIDVTLDDEAALGVIADLIPPNDDVRDASFDVVNNSVRIRPAKNGSRCCAPDTVGRVLDALRAGESEVDIDLDVTEAEFSTEDAEDLNISEPVGSLTLWDGEVQDKSFTTYFDADGGGRVTNIRRMADIVQGTLVLPGDRFSLNEVVGERTEDDGFEDGGAIVDGESVQEVGGGVSQFSTTMFNAAFYAGLPIDTYQAHSEYFDRYPFGREATLGFPSPDLVWTNDTPHGILVWSTSTDDSVTVTLYSTQHATAEQTDQEVERSGDCTTVTTERTITYPDDETGGEGEGDGDGDGDDDDEPRTETDTFRARYRDAGATSC